MNKYEVLICTGRLEEQLKGQETLLEKLKDLQKAIIENDSWFNFKKLKKQMLPPVIYRGMKTYLPLGYVFNYV